MRAALLCALVGSLALGGPLLYGPWTGAPEPTAITVSWAQSPATPVRVEYAPLEEFQASGAFPHAALYAPAGAAGRELVHFRLEGLLPSMRYAYRLVFPDGTASQVGTFATAVAPGEPVWMGVIADTQWQWEGLNRVELVATAMSLDPWPFHFVLHAGDLVETPVPAHWEFFFRSMAPVLLRAPFLPVLGNHERDSLTYYQHFALPPGGGRLGKRWWTLRFGDVIVVGLDSNARTPQDYHEQLSWLYQSLSGPEPHKIVMFHHPVFSSDAIYFPGVEGLQKLWHPAFVELGVRLVITGHAHNYERIVRDGVTYLVVGGGGATLRPLSPARLEGSQVAYDDWYFYVALRADETGIHGRTMGVAQMIDGNVVPKAQLLDEFLLPRK